MTETARHDERFKPGLFHCEVREGRASAVVEAHGELDLASVTELHEALHAAAASKRRVTLDLRELSFMDSTGLRLILDLAALARHDGFDFTLVRGPRAVQRLFTLTDTEAGLTFVDPEDPLIPPE